MKTLTEKYKVHLQNLQETNKLSEAELMRFAWFDDLVQVHILTVDDLRNVFGRKLNNGLVKPMSRPGLQWRRRLVKEAGIRK